MEEFELSDMSGHDVTVYNGDWLAWIGFAFSLGCLPATDRWLAALDG